MEIEQDVLKFKEVYTRVKEEEVKGAKLDAELDEIVNHNHHEEKEELPVDNIQDMVDNNILNSSDHVPKQKRRAYQSRGLRKKQKEVDS